jgi:hypothetical protein
MAKLRSRTVVAVALSVVVLLAGCSGSDSGDGEPSATSTGTPSASGSADAGVVTWADGVCSATTDLETAVQGVTTALQVDPTASASALEQAKTQVGERVGEVRVAADDLRAAINTSPPGVVSSQLAEAQGQLTASADSARAAAEQLVTQGGAIADAQTPAETVAALTAAGTALATTSAQIQAYLTSLSETAQNRDPVIREAFASAPACVSRGVAASPSS